jgi:hypothetical protein
MCAQLSVIAILYSVPLIWLTKSVVALRNHNFKLTNFSELSKKLNCDSHKLFLIRVATLD